MMNCIVIDDEPKAIEVLKRYIEKVDFLNLVETYRDPLKALMVLQNNTIDLLFLDINMPGISGIDFKKNIDTKAMVIFTTAYSEHAIESYNLNAVDYLLKPITFERFLKAVNKAFELQLLKSKKATAAVNNDTGFIFLKSGPQQHQVKLNEILFLEKDGNYLVVNLKDRKIVIRENMTDVFEVIPKEGFVRIHKSFVVALKHIQTIESEQVLINGVKVPIGITYKEEFLKALDAWKKNM